MRREFIIDGPEQLRELGRYVKSGSVLNVATVWSATRRGTGASPLDGKIYAAFGASGRGRKAQVYRYGINDTKRIMADLKYSPALAWCLENLEAVD